MRILLTGFTTFANHGVNPSQRIVDALEESRADLITAVLPVEYGGAGERLRALMAQHQPDAIVMLGLAASRTAINLERFALNINDASLPDNAGDHPRGRPIVPDGPAAYVTRLPIDTMQQALAARGIPAVISNHAGSYVCNHVFYVARHALEQSGSAIPCGFIHVPPIAEAGDQPGLPLAVLVEAVDCCLAVLRQPQHEYPETV
ncbi:MAG: hypothetical protein K8J31_23155 [Anaerolineae bacterium]|nr:hypothetical protein [Anaerolineae bacterium]